CMMQLVRRRTQPANESLTAELRVVICTTGDRHLLDRLPIDPVLFEHQPASAEPEMLGFECRDVLRDRSGEYDYYCYLEDDLVLHDPWLFSKLAWFTRQAGDENLLLPNRFERGPRPLVHKAYLDGDLAEYVAAAHQNVHETPELRSVLMGVPLLFQRPLNPHAGCFFLSAEQMARWMGRPYFLDRDCSFIGPLESAATLGILRTFRIYKPARQNASFLEIEHHGTRFLSQLRRPIAVDEEK
ncbi:MAG: calcium-binding protein, partial [Planctomycetaceae bacterium]